MATLGRHHLFASLGLCFPCDASRKWLRYRHIHGSHHRPSVSLPIVTGGKFWPLFCSLTKPVTAFMLKWSLKSPRSQRGRSSILPGYQAVILGRGLGVEWGGAGREQQDFPKLRLMSHPCLSTSRTMPSWHPAPGVSPNSDWGASCHLRSHLLLKCPTPPLDCELRKQVASALLAITLSVADIMPDG